MQRADRLPAIAIKPKIQMRGEIDPTTRPPSSGRTGNRLNRFKMNPVYAAAIQKVALRVHAVCKTQRGPIEPTSGPPSAMYDSCSTEAGFPLRLMSAPKPGMKYGSDAGIP